MVQIEKMIFRSSETATIENLLNDLVTQYKSSDCDKKRELIDNKVYGLVKKFPLEIQKNFYHRYLENTLYN